MSKDISQVLYSAEELAQRVEALGKEISQYYKKEHINSLLVVSVLRGSVIFFSDLIRHIDDLDLEFDFITISSYGSSAETCGKADILNDVAEKVAGRHVLIVEDIIDTGITMAAVVERFLAKGVKSLKLCTLLDKPVRRKVQNLKIDFCGFEVPDQFIVGYGLDYAGRYRQLPYIGVLAPSVYKK